MHKNDAALLFGVLSVGDRVKICKKLYVHGDMTLEQVNSMFEEAQDDNIKVLLDNNLIIKNNGVLSANKEAINELMDFIKTPCGCKH